MCTPQFLWHLVTFLLWLRFSKFKLCNIVIIKIMFWLLQYFYFQVIEVVPTRYRAERETVPKYLFSRSVAGTSHKDLIVAVDQISAGSIYGRFFPMFPARKFNLSRWLRDWIGLGAVPVATLNLQRGQVRPGQTIPEAWHHQVRFYGQFPDLGFMNVTVSCASSMWRWVFA